MRTIAMRWHACFSHENSTHSTARDGTARVHATREVRTRSTPYGSGSSYLRVLHTRTCYYGREKLEEEDTDAYSYGVRVHTVRVRTLIRERILSARVGLERGPGGQRRGSPLVERLWAGCFHWLTPIQPLLARPDSLVTPRPAQPGDGNERRMHLHLQCGSREEKLPSGVRRPSPLFFSFLFCHVSASSCHCS
jgi:hypothetical protein